MEKQVVSCTGTSSLQPIPKMYQQNLNEKEKGIYETALPEIKK